MRIVSKNLTPYPRPHGRSLTASLPAKRPETAPAHAVDPFARLLAVFPEVRPFFDYFQSHLGAGIIDIADRLPEAVYNLLDREPPQGPFFRMIREGSHDFFFDVVCVSLNREKPVVIFNGREDGQGGIGVFSNRDVFEKVFVDGCKLLTDFYRERFEIQVPRIKVPTAEPGCRWIGYFNPLDDTFFPTDVTAVLEGDDHKRYFAVDHGLDSLKKAPVRLTKRFLDLPGVAPKNWVFDFAHSLLHVLSATQIFVYPLQRQNDFYRFLLSDPQYASHDPNLRAILAQRIGDLPLVLKEEQRKFRCFLKEFGSGVSHLYTDCRKRLLATFPNANLEDVLTERLEGFLLRKLPEPSPVDFRPLALHPLPAEGILRWPQDF